MPFYRPCAIWFSVLVLFSAGASAWRIFDALPYGASGTPQSPHSSGHYDYQATDGLLLVACIGLAALFFMRWALDRYLDGQQIVPFSRKRTLLWSERDTQMAIAQGIILLPFFFVYVAFSIGFAVYSIFVTLNGGG